MPNVWIDSGGADVDRKLHQVLVNYEAAQMLLSRKLSSAPDLRYALRFTSLTMNWRLKIVRLETKLN